MRFLVCRQLVGIVSGVGDGRLNSLRRGFDPDYIFTVTTLVGQVEIRFFHPFWIGQDYARCAPCTFLANGGGLDLNLFVSVCYRDVQTQKQGCREC